MVLQNGVDLELSSDWLYPHPYDNALSPCENVMSWDDGAWKGQDASSLFLVPIDVAEVV